MKLQLTLLFFLKGYRLNMIDMTVILLSFCNVYDEMKNAPIISCIAQKIIKIKSSRKKHLSLKSIQNISKLLTDYFILP